MKIHEARTKGESIANLANHQEHAKAYALLAPILAERTPFSMLERIGCPVGNLSLPAIIPILDMITEHKTEGGWVVIGAALREQLSRDIPGAFAHCQRYIIAADIWYGADIFAERVPGPALLVNFSQTVSLLTFWRTNPNRWIRRAVGVAAHFWAKRTGGEDLKQAETLLSLLAPMFAEREMDALKGIGWGLKTMGRYYPNMVADWLLTQLNSQKPRALMIRKATTYLSPQQRERVMNAGSA